MPSTYVRGANVECAIPFSKKDFRETNWSISNFKLFTIVSLLGGKALEVLFVNSKRSKSCKTHQLQ